MVLFHPSIYYIDTKVFGGLLYQNLKHFSLRRLFLTIAFFIVIFFVQFFMLLFRLLDEVFYPAYRKTALNNPVFIISNPRSGTTYLHSLICLDEDRFTYFMLYHTFFPSILFYRFILLLKKIDSHLNWTMRRFFEWVEKGVFKGWQDIHPMGFEQSEEDEGIFVLQMMSPIIGMFCPWFKEIDYPFVSDKLSKKKKARMMAFYKNTLQRFSYAWGADKTILVKNVVSTGRINMLMETFPDAKIIYPVRHPYKIVPSMTSMFTATWAIIAPKLPKNSPEFRAWGEMIIAFYRHFMDEISHIDNDKLYPCLYQELMEKPKELVLDIYREFDFEVTPQFEKRLTEATNKAKKYKSKHSYSLEEYGYTKEQIYEPLKDVFERFNFEP